MATIQADPSTWLTGSALLAARKASWQPAQAPAQSNAWVISPSPATPASNLKTDTALSPTSSFIQKQQDMRASGAFGQTPAQKAAWETQVQSNAMNAVNNAVQPAYDQPAPKPTTPKTGDQPDFNSSLGREQEINQHLNEFYQGGATDLNSLRDMSWYGTADTGKKALIDSFYQSKQPKTPEDAFNAISVNGWQLPPGSQNTPQWQEALGRFQAIQPYLKATPDSLYAAMVSGKLVPWSAAYNDLVKASGGIESPAIIEAKQRYQAKVNSDRINRDTYVASGDGSKPVPEPSPTVTTSNNVVNTKGLDYALEFQKDIVNNPEITKLAQTVRDTDKQIADLEADKAKTLKRIQADHPGISTGLLYEVAAEQNWPINDQLTQLRNQRALDASNLDYKTNIAQKMFDYKIDQAKTEAATTAQRENILQQQAFQVSQTRQAQQFSALQNERNFTQQKEIADIQNKYQTSRDVQNYKQDLTKIGIQNVLSIDKDKLNFEQQKQLTAIQNKYQDSRDVATFNRDIAKMQFSYENDPDKIAKANENVISSSWGNNEVDPIKSSETAAKALAVDDWINWGSCGQFVNDKLGTPGFFWDSLSQKESRVNSSVPVVGSAVIMSSSKFPWNGHVGIVTKVNWDQVIVKDSNWRGDNIVHEHNLDANNPSIKWYYVPTKQTSSGIVTTILWSGKFTKDQAKAVKNAINNGEDPETVIKNQAKDILGGTEKTKLINAESVQSSMSDLKDSLNAFYAAGWDTGILKGNFEKVSNSLWEVQDPRLAQLAVEVQAQLQTYRNAISGTAYSDQEGKDIASVFPGINKSKQLNDSIFAGRDKALQSQIDGLYKSVLGSSYDKIKSSGTNATKNSTPNTPSVDIPSVTTKLKNAGYSDAQIQQYLTVKGLKQ